MKQRLLTGLLMVLIGLPIIYYGGLAVEILIGFVVIFANYEILSVIKMNDNIPFLLTLIIFTFTSYLVDNSWFLLILISFLIFVYLLTIVKEKILVEYVNYLFVMMFILTLAIRSFRILNGYGYLAILYLLFAVFGCDVGAYFFGYFFGKHKLNPRISPKKTWEGAIGGWFSGFVLSFIWGSFLVKDLPFIIILSSSLLMPIISQIGDLSFSAIKRRYNIKDFGSIFPGHGGVLDRIDSLLFCLIAFYAVLLFM